MMMITAMILATGPWTDSSTFWSGSSQGMPEPAACAWPRRGGRAATAAARPAGATGEAKDEATKHHHVSLGLGLVGREGASA
jgi:hypothetical protein